MADPVKKTLEELRATGAPDFFERDPAVIKDDLRTRFEAISGRTLYPAQTEMFLIEVAAYALSVLGEAAQNAVLQNTVVFSEGVHLDNRAANVSTYRLAAQPAVTTLEFRLAEIRLLDTVVPAGTRVSAGGSIVFATDSDLTVPAGMLAASVTATAVEPGARWNGLGIGAVRDILDPVAFIVEASNTSEVTGGTDVEDQERFRLRAANALFTIAKTGPRNGYREHVLAVNPEIVDVAVIRPEPGYIDIYPLMRAGVPSVELKAAVLAYLDPETLRPMGDEVAVLDPIPVGFDVTLTVRVLEASAGMEENARAAAEAAFEPWNQSLGSQIAPSVIVSAVKSISGVTDVEIAGLAFTDLAAAQFAVLSSLTVIVEVTPNV